MRPRFIRITKDESGATIIEFAFVAPVLFLLILGIVEFGLIMHISSVVENAVNEGARLAITGSEYQALNPDGLDRAAFIDELIRKRLGPWLHNQSDLIVTSRSYANITLVNLGDTTNDTGNTYGGGNQAIMYIAEYNWNIITPIMSSFMGDDEGNFNIRSTVITKNENYCANASGLSCQN